VTNLNKEYVQIYCSKFCAQGKIKIRQVTVKIFAFIVQLHSDNWQTVAARKYGIWYGNKFL
jgi:hypothetical protein